MNRAIKFRVWDMRLKQYWHNLEGATRHGIIIDSDGMNGLVCDLTTVYEPKSVNYFENTYLVTQQFTGLKDKNEKDIYEGNILRLFSGQIYKVFFHIEDDTTDCSGYLFSSFGAEIIGNIYENPELLTK